MSRFFVILGFLLIASTAAATPQESEPVLWNGTIYYPLAGPGMPWNSSPRDGRRPPSCDQRRRPRSKVTPARASWTFGPSRLYSETGPGREASAVSEVGRSRVAWHGCRGKGPRIRLGGGRQVGDTGPVDVRVDRGQIRPAQPPPEPEHRQVVADLHHEDCPRPRPGSRSSIAAPGPPTSPSNTTRPAAGARRSWGRTSATRCWSSATRRSRRRRPKVGSP